MDERMQRQAEQKAVAVRTSQDAVATDVQDGVSRALTTHSPNQFAMTFEGQDQSGRKIITPYVKKAGRSVVLNEVAKKKGGLAKLYSVCVRSAQETKADLLDILKALPAEMKTDFIKSRAGDYRCLSVPDGTALYKFVILFKSGEKWEGEGIANVRNVRAAQLHTRLDEMAETRAFMRAVGRGTADGFISPEQAAGSDHYDVAEAELLAEDQASEQEAIDISNYEEAGPDGSDTFRSPDGGGAVGGYPGEGGSGEFTTDHTAEEGLGGGGEAEPIHAGSVGGAGDLRQDSGAGAGEAGGFSVNDLMNIARQKGVFLKGFAKDHTGKDELKALTAAERTGIYNALLDMPTKGE